MDCPKCGTETGGNEAFCTRCGTPTAVARTGVNTALLLQRPIAITLIGWLDILGGFIVALLGLLFIGVSPSEGHIGASPAILAGIGIVFLLFGAITFFAGIGLLKLKAYGRVLQMGLSSLGLLGFPLGTVISGFVLYYLLKPGVALLFSDKRPEQFTPAEIAEIARAKQAAGVVVGVVAVLAALMVVGFIGIVAAITIPAFMRARQAGNEWQAIGRLRAVVNAEAVYATSNGSYYDTLECLTGPARCLHGTPPAPLPRSVIEDGAYVGTLFKGEPAPPSSDGAISRSSITAFAYVLVPASAATGRRMFCGDVTGVIRVADYEGTRPPAVPPLSTGVCPERWIELWRTID